MMPSSLTIRWMGTLCCTTLALGAPCEPAGQRIAQGQVRLGSPFELSDAVQLDEVDSAALTRLEPLGAFLADAQWDEAVERLREVMEVHGQQMIALDSYRYVRVRDYCHLQIAGLPDEALQLYRERVDPMAQRWYEEGIEGRDWDRLQRVVDELFCSSWGDDALLALGEFALQRGWFGQARRHWKRISWQSEPRLKDGRPAWQSVADDGANAAEIEALLAVQGERRLWIEYPDTDIDLAMLRARLVLVSILEGEPARAVKELALFRHWHPDAAGRLAGRHVQYVDALTALIEQSSDWPLPEPAADWPTFAGSQGRTCGLPPADRFQGPAWENPLALFPPLTAGNRVAHGPGLPGQRRVAESSEGLLSYHPVIVNDLLFVNNESTILAYDLRSGKPAWQQEDPAVFRADEASRMAAAHPSRIGVPRYTMTVHRGRLYARMGEPATSRPPDPNLHKRSGYLVCLDLESDGRLVWKIEPDDWRWAFEGSPVVQGENVFVAMRFSDVRPQAHVACFHAQTGELKWRRFICAADTIGRGQVVEITHNLLTLVEDRLYCNTNLGAVAALSTRDGRMDWISLYPRARRVNLSQRASHFYRDLNPCVHYQGMVMAAPSDSAEIFALDAGTGVMIWSSDLAKDAVHLLGVARGTLMASGHQLWWLDAWTGKVVSFWPESPSTGMGYGRGVIVGDEVYWPARDRIHIFPCQPGGLQRETQEPIRLAPAATGGNVLVLGNYLLIAAAEKIYGFTHDLPPTRRPQDPIMAGGRERRYRAARRTAQPQKAAPTESAPSLSQGLARQSE